MAEEIGKADAVMMARTRHKWAILCRVETETQCGAQLVHRTPFRSRKFAEQAAQWMNEEVAGKLGDNIRVWHEPVDLTKHTGWLSQALRIY